MKTSGLTQPPALGVLTALFLVISVTLIRADTNFVSRFDTASEVESWAFDFGSVTHTNSFDPTMDGNTNASSGAMRVTLGFDPALGGESKGAYIIPLSAPISGDDILNLDRIHMDVKIDSASATDAFGLNGYFQLA